MGKHKIEQLLKALADRGIERARPELSGEVRARIPERLVAHRMDTINIIVDLRISRLAGAAVILLAMLVIGSFLGGRDATGMQVLEDSKLFLRYTLGGENACKAEFLGNLAQFRDALIAQGREVVYYGKQANFNDPCAVIMHWKLSDDRYGVILGDMTARTVNAKTLITLQDHMLRERAK
ncbi:MAG: hypothetical protein MUC88_08115 [Planctomycetes bacterium]|jgi:hypothetical protein|nr:hypothetical protein [Planctomycetota bacterium]